MKKRDFEKSSAKQAAKDAARQAKQQRGKPRNIQNVYYNMPAIGLASLSGYSTHGATDDKDLDWLCVSGSPRTDIDLALPRLRARSRDLFISSTLISAAIQTRAAGAIGAGLRLDATPDAAALALDARTAETYDRRIEAAFSRWAQRAGTDGQSLDDIMQAVAIGTLLSGDIFLHVIVQGDRIAVSVIEGDRVETPVDLAADDRIRSGVHLATSGRPIAYYISDGEAYNAQIVSYTRRPAFRGGYYDTASGEWIPPAGGIIHAHMPFERPGQQRGIPAVSKVLLDAKTLDRYKAAEAQAAAVAATTALLITHPAEDATAQLDMIDSFGAMPAGDADGCGHEKQGEVGTVHPAMDLKPAGVYHLEPGADVRSFGTNRPNTAFPAFCDAYDARICAALGLPAEVVQRRYDSSYSASRAARLDADLTYRLDRARIIAQVLMPIYRAWLDLNAQRLDLDGYYTDASKRFAWQKADFLGEAVPSIDPEKEVNAAILAINAGLSTRAREARLLNGMDTGTIIRVLATEEAQMRAAGLVKNQNGEPIQ